MILASVGVVMMYTMPTYEKVKKLQQEESHVSQTLGNASKLKEIIEDLKRQYDNFPVETREKLAKMLPDVVEPIDVIVEVNSIADNRVIVSDAKASNEEVESNPELFVYKPYSTIKATYDVSADYSRLLDFIHDLEHNLRLTDISKLDITADDGSGFIDVTVDTNTYWLTE